MNDSKRLAEIRRKLRKLRTAMALAIICTIGAVSCFVGSIYLENSAYTEFTTFSPSATHQQRRASLIRAIQLAPDRLDAYILLLECYNESGSASKTEIEEYLGVYNKNFSALDTSDPNYGMLHSLSAQLIINSDGPFADRMRLALPFYETAAQTLPVGSEAQSVAECSAKIGSYYRDFIWKANAGSKEISAAEMDAILNDISDTIEKLRIEENDSSVASIVGFADASINLLYNQRTVIARLIPQDTVETVVNQVYEALPDPVTIQSEQTREIVIKLLSSERLYRDAINRELEKANPPEPEPTEPVVNTMPPAETLPTEESSEPENPVPTETDENGQVITPTETVPVQTEEGGQ